MTAARFGPRLLGLLAGGAAALLAAVAGAPRADAAPLALAPAEGVRVQPYGVYGAAREAVVAVVAPASFTAPITVPPGARLISAVAVPDRVWTAIVADTAAPLRFRVVFEGEDGGPVVLYERTVDIAAAPADRRWFDFGRDLAPLAGRRGTLRFETTPARVGARPTLALWAPPEMVACGDGTAPSLLLVTVDALRGDHLSGAGYARPTTPRLDAFAGDATFFAAAFAAGPKTIPSIPQILTGTWYFRQRATPGVGFLGPGRYELSRAVVNNPFVAGWLEHERPGFETLVAGELDARAITSAALRYLSAVGPCPAALYLHYLDTHTPYRPPRHWARKFIDPHAATTIGLDFGDVTGAWQGRYQGADRQRIVDLYDGAIAWTDRQLGRLLRGLARRGLGDRTLVLITADHGEELWDHGQFFHGQSLYDELLHVPLLARFPAAGRGVRVATPVSTVDLMPTIAAVAGFETAAGDGVSLASLSALAGARAPGATSRAADDEARVVYATVSRTKARTPPRQAVRSATAKLIRNVEDGSFELYDLVADPHERHDLGVAAPGAAELVRQLDARRSQIAATGDHLRLRSTSERPVAYTMTLTGDTPLTIVEPDRLTLEDGDRIWVGDKARALILTGMLEAGGEDHIRMEILEPTGLLAITVQLDGAPAPSGTVRLGPAATPALGTHVDIGAPTLVGAPMSLPANAPPVTVSFWRVAGGAAEAAAPDAATRERLRTLGYAE